MLTIELPRWTCPGAISRSWEHDQFDDSLLPPQQIKRPLIFGENNEQKGFQCRENYFILFLLYPEQTFFRVLAQGLPPFQDKQNRKVA